MQAGPTPLDPLPFYRAWCAEWGAADMPAGAPIGLAECGDRQDAGLLWPLTQHPNPAIRSRAVAGLRTLDVFDAGRLTPLLDDPSPAVTRETVTSLTPSAQRIPVDHLVDRLAPDRPRHQRLAATRLLAAQGGLQQLQTLRALLRDEDDKVRERAGKTVGLGSSFPTSAMS
ncbi:HEAT repeat domain-containing protein [Streptomyces chryseus]